MQEAGWWVRSEIIWHKPNPMPESAKDRPHQAHEKLFLFTKSPKYFYNASAVRQTLSPKTLTTLNCEHKVRDGQTGTKAANMGSTVIKMPDGWDNGTGGHGTIHRKGREKGKRQHVRANDDRRVPPKHKGCKNHQSLVDVQTGTANLKNVWSIAPRRFTGAHFATFPIEIPEYCIAAGCPSGGNVLDPFGGAGTTALAAKNLNRDAILIELNPEYVQIAMTRLRENLCQVSSDHDQVIDAGPLFESVSV
jgi:DNA modification methylase